MSIAHYLFSECSLKRAAQPKPVVNKKKRTNSMLTFHVYNYTALDRFRYANYSQSARREYAQQEVVEMRFSFADIR